MKVPEPRPLVKRARLSPRVLALKMLARRPRSASEIRRGLLRKGVSEQAVEQELRSLTTDRLIDDAQFARQLLESVLDRKPVGRRWLVARFRRAGIPSSIVARVLTELFPLARERALAERAAAAKRLALGKQHGRDPTATRSVLTRFLLARGFSPALAYEVGSRDAPARSTEEAGVPYADHWSEPSS